MMIHAQMFGPNPIANTMNGQPMDRLQYGHQMVEEWKGTTKERVAVTVCDIYTGEIWLAFCCYANSLTAKFGPSVECRTRKWPRSVKQRWSRQDRAFVSLLPRLPNVFVRHSITNVRKCVCVYIRVRIDRHRFFLVPLVMAEAGQGHKCPSIYTILYNNMKGSNLGDRSEHRTTKMTASPYDQHRQGQCSTRNMAIGEREREREGAQMSIKVNGKCQWNIMSESGTEYRLQCYFCPPL